MSEAEYITLDSEAQTMCRGVAVKGVDEQFRLRAKPQRLAGGSGRKDKE